MRAVRLESPGQRPRIVELPLPEPRGHEVRVRVLGCGVCHTDLHIVDGSQVRVELPVTLGHEAAGIVDAAGPAAAPLLAGAGLSIGDPVLVFGGWGCGSCDLCVAGDEQLCPRSRAPGFQVDGGYADAIVVPEPRHLVALGSLDPVRAAPLADAGVTPYRAVRRVERWLVPGARVLVIGAGGLGEFALQYLRLLPAAGAELIVGVVERSQERLDRSRQLGADVGLLNGGPEDSRDGLGGPADVVLDLVGSDETLALAAEVVAPGGVVMLVGEAGGRLPFGFDRPAVESWLTTAAWGSRADLEAVVRLAREERLRWEVEPMPLDQHAEAHDRLRAGAARGRIVLVP